MIATPQQIVEALTRDQARTVSLAFVKAVASLDASGDVPSFVKDMRAASDMAERFAIEVPA